MTELEEYATQTPAPVDSVSVQNVVLYRKACQKMFERGILEKKGFIKAVNSPLLASLRCIKDCLGFSQHKIDIPR